MLSEPQPVQEFARRFQKHAQEIISRVKAKQQDDLNIFEDDMGAVADGRFYQPVDGDPTRYSLKDDGLTLALGFAVIDRLRTAQRNDRNLDAELDAILEPIAALDDTADVILVGVDSDRGRGALRAGYCRLSRKGVRSAPEP